MARIYLDARNITDRPAGVARYARALIPALVEAAPHHEFRTIRHRSNLRPIDVGGAPNFQEIFVDAPIDNAENFLFGHRTLQAAFARGGAPDLYHSLFHILPRSAPAILGKAKLITTVHDFLWLDHPDATQPTFLKARSIQAFARLAIPSALRLADAVIAISEPTRRRAATFTEDEKITTISHGVGEEFFQPPALPSGEFAELVDPDRPCIVAIGNDKEYKNLSLLIEAFAALLTEGTPARLVLIGSCQGLIDTVAHTGFSEWITLTEHVHDETLRRILGHARAFVFPSRIEGFGLPILEAMAMGTPALIADAEPMRTIADEAALFFHPDDARGLTTLLSRLLGDDDLANEFAAKGRRRAASFRWPETAARTLAVYDSLLS